MNRVKTTLDLPSWFDLSNYDRLLDDSYDEVNLLYQVSVRSALIRSICDEGELKRAGYLESWESIKCLGLIPKEEYFVPKVFVGNVVKPISLDEAILIGDIAKTIREMMESISKVEPENKEVEICRKMLKSHALQRYFDFSRSIFFSEEVDNSPENLHLVVNTLASDKDITLELETILEEHRSKLEVQVSDNIFRQSVVRKIVDYRIIPILDLFIWEKLENTKISNSVLSAAVFPLGDKGEYEIRMTIRPLAFRVISNEFIKGWMTYVKASDAK